MSSEIISQAGSAYQNLANPRQRILVVEDDANIRRFNTQALVCSGYQVDAVADGAAAWNALQQHNYDLMITDNQMPKVTGTELIQKLLDARIPLPVIMATCALPEQEFTRRSPLQPAMTLLKPHTFGELLEAVKAVLFLSHQSLAELAPPPNWQAQPQVNS